jgi:exopolysaccharide biosynthesis polyprenyl glycosylphosphotransferase
VGADLMAVGLALGVASAMRFWLEWFEVNESSLLALESHVTAGALWLAAMVGLMAANRLYDEDTLVDGHGEVARLCQTIVEALGLLSITIIFMKWLAISRSWFALLILLSLGLLIVERKVFRRELDRQRQRGRYRRRALLVSKGGEAWDPNFVEQLSDFDIVAHVNQESLQRYLNPPNRVGEPGRNVWDKTALIVPANQFDDDDLWRLVMQAGQAGCAVFLQSKVRSVGRDRLAVREINGNTMMKITPPKLTGMRAVQKRMLDISISLSLLILLSPLFVVLATALLATSGWPIFFGQDRAGKDGQIFTMWKFRTMRVDHRPGADQAYATPDDPRRTRLGAILRRTSLDELPQLWNVLRGDMSLVGPRPEMSTFAMLYSEEMPWYRFRHRIRPGITGLAQVRGLRGTTEIEPRADMDNWYIEHWSIGLDISVILSTIKAIVVGENAY